MKKVITLRRGDVETVEFPDSVEPRSGFGALRLFPGIAKSVTEEELLYIERNRPDVFARLAVQPYVESRRIDRRGMTEAEFDAIVVKEGIDHLPFGRAMEVLRKRGLVKSTEAHVAVIPGKAKSGKAEEPEGPRRKRK